VFFFVFFHFRMVPESEECWHFLSLTIDLENKIKIKIRTLLTFRSR